MPMIDTDHLEPSLLLVQKAEETYYAAMAALRVAVPYGKEAARMAVEKTKYDYDNACVGLYGYIDGAVKKAKAEAARKG